MSTRLAATGGRIIGGMETAQTSCILVEEKEHRKWAAKAAADAERRDRYLDARQRTIGLDLEALDRQVAEKKARKAAEAEAELAWAEEQERIRRAIVAYETAAIRKKEVGRAQVKAELFAGVTAHKLTETAKLNDKDALKKQKPSRVGDYDPRCGPASFQKFDGEDLHAAERNQLQKEQFKKWVAAMHAEKVGIHEAEKEAERRYAAYLAETARMREEFEKATLEERHKMRIENRLENEMLAKMKKDAADFEKAMEKKMEEDHLSSSFSKGVGIGTSTEEDAWNPSGKIIRNNYKGMTPQQRAEIIAEQARQRGIGREEERKREMDEDMEYARKQVEVARQAARWDAEVRKMKADEDAKHLAYLEKQRAEERARIAKEKADRKNGYITDGFFGGFGKSCR